MHKQSVNASTAAIIHVLDKNNLQESLMQLGMWNTGIYMTL